MLSNLFERENPAGEGGCLVCNGTKSGGGGRRRRLMMVEIEKMRKVDNEYGKRLISNLIFILILDDGDIPF